MELNHADAAEAITALYKEYACDVNKVSTELGLPVRTVRDYVNIEERATPRAKELLKSGKVRKTDVKRAIDAAQGDEAKADELLKQIPKLTGYEKRRAVEYGMAHPDVTADKIIEEGRRPRIEKTVILNLTTEMDAALRKAESRLSMGREEIAVRALREWLDRKGFLRR